MLIATITKPSTRDRRRDLRFAATLSGSRDVSDLGADSYPCAASRVLERGRRAVDQRVVVRRRRIQYASAPAGVAEQRAHRRQRHEEDGAVLLRLSAIPTTRTSPRPPPPRRVADVARSRRWRWRYCARARRRARVSLLARRVPAPVGDAVVEQRRRAVRPTTNASSPANLIVVDQRRLHLRDARRRADDLLGARVERPASRRPDPDVLAVLAPRRVSGRRAAAARPIIARRFPDRQRDDHARGDAAAPAPPDAAQPDLRRPRQEP